MMAKVKGRYLLLRAAKADASPTSLFVRYGKKNSSITTWRRYTQISKHRYNIQFHQSSQSKRLVLIKKGLPRSRILNRNILT